MEFKYMENTKYLILALVGVIMACLGLLTFMFQPIQLIINSMMVLQPDNMLFNLWSDPPIQVLAKIYIFNVTNPEAFLAGKEKLRVEEIGPYTYQEFLKNAHAKFNDNGTVTYKPTREYEFKREHSSGDENLDYIIVPNIPLLGIGSMMTSFNTFVNFGFNMMTGNAKQFMNLTVAEYMWGYEDKLVSLASTFIPTWIDFPTFGIMDRFTTRDAGNAVTVYLNETRDVFNNTYPPYAINEFNGSPGLKVWNYQEVPHNETHEANSKCNTIRGAYEGGLFPRDMKENTTIRMYRHAFCRPVNLLYHNTSTSVDGYKVYNYKVDPNFLQSGDINPENKCYCLNDECMPSGFNTLAPCYYGIPIIISQPHYLNADEEVASQVDGLHPDEEKHNIIASLNPEVGIPLNGKLRVQVNLQVKENRALNKLKPFYNKIIPLLWIEMDVGDPSPQIKFLMNLVIYVGPIVEKLLMWGLGIFGLSLISVSALIVLYFPPTRRLEDPYHRIGYSPILVIPLSSRLKTDMRIS